MKIVQANGESMRLKVKIKELGRIARNGETFKIEDYRLPILTGSNKFGTPFVSFVRDSVDTSDCVPDVNFVEDEEPEIYIVENGGEPIRVDETLTPIVEKTQVEMIPGEEVPNVVCDAAPDVEEKPKKKTRKKKAVVEE